MFRDLRENAVQDANGIGVNRKDGIDRITHKTGHRHRRGNPDGSNRP